MGLDITAYEAVELLPPHPHTEECSDTGHILAFVTVPSFNQSLRGLEEHRCYRSVGETYSFRAGSYSGYNRWREDLCRLVFGGISIDDFWVVGPDHYRHKPFFELLYFSDCEGTIGPEACVDLFHDFRRYEDSFRESMSATQYFDWLHAFDLASIDGCVRFH